MGSERGTPVVHSLVKPKTMTSVSQVGQEAAKAHAPRISHGGPWTAGSPRSHMLKLLLSTLNIFMAEETASCPFLQLEDPQQARPAVLKAGKELKRKTGATVNVLDILVKGSTKIGSLCVVWQMRTRSSCAQENLLTWLW